MRILGHIVTQHAEEAAFLWILRDAAVHAPHYYLKDLASLDEGMQGHATLHLTVERDGELIGRGSLLPGRFAEIDQGYRVGFAGLEKWSEIDISRRHQGGLVLAGMGLAVAGAALWGVAAWRRW